ncbi:UNVERIFIED_CONTAM: Cadmium-induced protein AS8 [Sesamum calycinum]|uniref:Cadmium-induced protein AS8 n=1 Tax=Sesamum calycinum TaxID=2727403 RepID=A0AAW2LZ40_9LAMI
MIIKSLFRRYERWNPVHPTYGTFWGIGAGIGCGIGWGPGFGPEVIGYVGAGCGAGFHVGITLLGVGIGLPAYYLPTLPHSGSKIRLSSGGYTEAFSVTKVCTLYRSKVTEVTRMGKGLMRKHLYIRTFELHKSLKKTSEVFNSLGNPLQLGAVMQSHAHKTWHRSLGDLSRPVRENYQGIDQSKAFQNWQLTDAWNRIAA